jgi:hypothetical protein
MRSSLADALRAFYQNQLWPLSALFLIVLLSRLPFLDAGYGANVDAWRVARVAHDIATSGEYSVSRFPGYPVQEIVCSWFWNGGPIMLNGLTALFSAAVATTFAAIGRDLTFRHWWLAGLALAATPIFFVSSVCAKDYMWALAFVLAAVLCSLHERSTIAGMFLGLATGCRITSIAMALPIALILVTRSSARDRWRHLSNFAAVTAIVVLVALSPVWFRYGTGFFTFYENHDRPGWPIILSRATVEIWGSVGLVGISIALGYLFFRRAQLPRANKAIVAAFLLGLAIYVPAYLRLPDQAGYLLPAVPLTLLLLLSCVPDRAAQILCFCLLPSPFIEFAKGRIEPGAILADRAERLQTMMQVRDFVGYSQTLPGHNTIVVGAWEPQIAVMAPQLAHSRTHYVYLLSEAELIAAFERGEHVFYLPAMRAFNYRVNGLDLAAGGALDLHALFLRQQAERAGQK